MMPNDPIEPETAKLDMQAFEGFARQPWMCTACGNTGVFGYDASSMTADDINFFDCECGAEGKKIKTGDTGNA